MDEVGPEAPSDADSDLNVLNQVDDPIARIKSVTDRSDRARFGKVLLGFRCSDAVDIVLPM